MLLIISFGRLQLIKDYEPRITQIFTNTNSYHSCKFVQFVVEK